TRLPRARALRTSADDSVDFPTPGGPVRPTVIARPVRSYSRRTSSAPRPASAHEIARANARALPSSKARRSSSVDCRFAKFLHDCGPGRERTSCGAEESAERSVRAMTRAISRRIAAQILGGVCALSASLPSHAQTLNIPVASHIRPIQTATLFHEFFADFFHENDGTTYVQTGDIHA